MAPSSNDQLTPAADQANVGNLGARPELGDILIALVTVRATAFTGWSRLNRRAVTESPDGGQYGQATPDLLASCDRRLAFAFR